MPSVSSAKSATGQQTARYQKLAQRRADVIAKLSVDLTAAAMIAAPLYDRRASAKAHVAHSSVEILTQLIGYVCNLGDSSAYTVGEFQELYETYYGRGWVTGSADVEVAAFLTAYEAR